MRHRDRWTEEEHEELINICLAYPTGRDRELAAQRFVERMNADPSNPIEPAAMGQALRAASKAIRGSYDGKPKASKAFVRLIEAGRWKGKVK